MDTLALFRAAMDRERQSARTTFQSLDKNGDGTLSPDELKEGLKQMGVECDTKTSEKIIKRFDFKQDGKLHFWEFIKLVQNVYVAGVKEGESSSFDDTEMRFGGLGLR